MEWIGLEYMRHCLRRFTYLLSQTSSWKCNETNEQTNERNKGFNADAITQSYVQLIKGPC